MKKKILIASDHAGFDMKTALVACLKEEGYEVKDFGDKEPEPEDDYPDFVAPLAKEISENPELMGIVIGGSGQGEAMCANRFKGVRAAVFNGPTSHHLTDKTEEDEIVLSRKHNNANILSLGARFLSVEDAKEAAKKWLEMPFSGDERHIRRIKKLDEI